MSLCSCCNFNQPALTVIATKVKTATDAIVTNNKIAFYACDGTVLAEGLCPWTTFVLLRCNGDEDLARVLVQAGEA